MSDETRLADLLDVRDARLVVIHDAWVGLNDRSPIVGIWELQRASKGEFVGKGTFSNALAGKVVDISISSRTAKRFLNAIAGALVVPGPYQPYWDHTDDFPHIEIAVHVEVRGVLRKGGTALLFTESQGDFHAPWGAFVAGHVLTIPGDEIGRALAALRAPLKRGILDQMERGDDVRGEHR
jgi:hypothetical protein